MNRKAVTAAFICLWLSTALFPQERKLKLSDLPAPVAKTAVTESKGKTVRAYSQETEKGQVVYEVSLVVDGHSKEVQIDASGAVLEIEEQVNLENLPPSVKSALLAKAGSGTITKVESVIKKQKLVAYEAQVNTKGKKSEIQVAPDGGQLDHEE